MDRTELTPGTVFADRFIVERVAGKGGMGVVYRARDRKRNGATVALKVLLPFAHRRHFHERFSREAYMLSELRHPGIVSYVDHGIAAGGRAFLAMEWLDGEDLDERLDRCGLTLLETVNMFRGVADALSAAHRRGFVHRDLKPENIFLRYGHPALPTLLDFGVARLMASELTGTGLAVGTPFYMAPEQARGDRNIGPSADVFALGCLMYACLTGLTPLAAGQTTVVLPDMLLDDFVNLRAVRPDIPEKLDLLIQRMLAKEPAQRPKDAGALLQELNALGPLPGEHAQGANVREACATSLLSEETEAMQLVSVILVVEDRAVASGHPCEEPSPSEKLRALGDTLRDRFDARLEILPGGSLRVTSAQTERTTVTDQSVQAARCALFLRGRFASRRIVITTGPAVVAGQHMPTGEADSNDWPGIYLDAMTAHLLDARFQMRPEPSGFFMLDSELAIDDARLLLGKPTRCMGRERELAQLQRLLDECCANSVARLGLVIGQPGVGKSRLRHEFVRSVRRGPSADVWIGRSDPTRASTPYGLIADALRRLVDVHDDEELAVQQGKLAERVRQHVPPGEARFVSEFLGELCGIPFPSTMSPKLLDARLDRRTMVTHVTAAFLAFLRAECAAHPVLLVLEDLHWGDELTVRVIDALLRDCHDQPLMVLALARPEVADLYPKLWSECRGRQELQLDGLDAQASAQLVLQALGASAAPAVVTRIVEQAAGNVLFLEELIRFVAENRTDDLPDTVVAILQARLQHLEPELQRVLRAASVYGGTFWRGGVLALMRQHMPSGRIDKHLEELTRRELITKNGSSRLLGDSEYTFRHSLVREAAHGLLTDRGRKAGHRAAAEFLQATGEHDPNVLAEHYALGGELDRATVFYARAAAEALDHANLREVSRLAEQGIACGAKGELRGSLRGVQARALMMDCDYLKGYALVSEALPLLHRGSVDWCNAVGTMVVAMLSSLNRYDEALEWGEVLRTTDPEPDAIGAYVESLRSLSGMLTLLSRREEVKTYLARMDTIVETSHRLPVRGSWEFSHAHAGWYLSRDPWSASMAAARAEALFEMVNHRRHLTRARIYRGISLAHLGNIDAGEEKLRTARAEALRDGDKFTDGIATLQLAMALADKEDGGALHDQEEAEQLLRSYLEHPGDDNLEAFGNAILGQIFLDRGALDLAECHLGQALDGLIDFVALRPYADATRVKILLRRGRVVEAREHANAALIRLDRLGGGGFAEVRLKLAAFEAYAAAGDPSAERILEGIIDQIGIRADAIGDSDARMRYLTTNPINRRALEMAHAINHRRASSGSSSRDGVLAWLENR
ncbi:protein kinase [Pendulispora rubella]|uniref:Protein kinase n=1 Tax=Pendulispora rubella TaxID=2741070 RepID=A0ABZ2KPI5_9BACT